MSSDTDLIRGEIWQSLRLNKGSREAFVSAHLSSNIGAQIFALRESRGWSQDQLASEVGMAQPRISVLEGGYDNYSLRTLKRLASAFDVAVIARFVPFSELVNWVTELSERQLAPIDFANDNLLQPLAAVMQPSGIVFVNQATRALPTATAIVPTGGGNWLFGSSGTFTNASPINIISMATDVTATVQNPIMPYAGMGIFGIAQPQDVVTWAGDQRLSGTTSSAIGQLMPVGIALGAANVVAGYQAPFATTEMINVGE